MRMLMLSVDVDTHMCDGASDTFKPAGPGRLDICPDRHAACLNRLRNNLQFAACTWADWRMLHSAS
jgi:hypothetical protein